MNVTIFGEELPMPDMGDHAGFMHPYGYFVHIHTHERMRFVFYVSILNVHTMRMEESKALTPDDISGWCNVTLYHIMEGMTLEEVRTAITQKYTEVANTYLRFITEYKNFKEWRYYTRLPDDRPFRSPWYDQKSSPTATAYQFYAAYRDEMAGDTGPFPSYPKIDTVPQTVDTAPPVDFQVLDINFRIDWSLGNTAWRFYGSNAHGRTWMSPWFPQATNPTLEMFRTYISDLCHD